MLETRLSACLYRPTPSDQWLHRRGGSDRLLDVYTQRVWEVRDAVAHPQTEYKERFISLTGSKPNNLAACSTFNLMFAKSLNPVTAAAKGLKPRLKHGSCVPVSAAVDSTVELLLFPAWIFTESISNAHTDVNTASQRVLSVILHHYVSDTQFKVLDILTNMSILLGYQLPGFNRGFSPFAAAVTGFKLLANIKLNLEQAARLFGLLPVSDMKCSLYSVCYNDV
ncbi:hypothetical protein BU17DRAFT_103040 [Hysterangium stoloniferum]|nr:hypothetical protein BU17DRAFT_103040 [Hysterangium stoloniferum]